MGAGASIEVISEEETNEVIDISLEIKSIYDPPRLPVMGLTENDIKTLLPDFFGDDLSEYLNIQKLIKDEIGILIPFYRLVSLCGASWDDNYSENLFNYLQLYTQSDEDFEKRKNYCNYVNLSFLLVFAREHSIPDDMKIFEVVEKIIKPLTLEAKGSYVKSKLWRKHPQFHGEKEKHPLDPTVPKAHYSFVSLNWDMSFHELLMAVSAYPEEHYAQEGRFTSPVMADLGQCSYYYIDIFSDNMHEPKSMKEDMKKRFSDILDSESMVIPATMEENGNIGLCNQTLVDLVSFLSRIKEGDARSDFVPVYFSFNNEKEKVDKLLESIGFIGDVPEGSSKGIIRRRTKEKSHQRIMELVNASGISFGSIEVDDELSKNRRKTFSKAELFEIFQELKYFGDKSICEEERLDQRLKRFLGNNLFYHCYRYYYPELYHCLNVYADHTWESARTAIETIIHRDWGVSIDHRVLMNSMEELVPPFTAVASAFIHLIAVIEDVVFKCEEDPVVFDEGGPYGVSLEFLHDFIKRYNISYTMTTGEVVEKIIKPETAETKETYVKAKLWKKQPGYFIDLRQEMRELEFMKRYARPSEGETFYGNLSIFERYYVAFLSHAWLMPFVKLVEIAYQAPATHFGQFGNLASINIVASRSFYWIDIFCKNQHVPAPAMDEFYRAIEAPGRVVAAMWPSRPVALNRVWCLYELWTSLHRKVELVPTFPGDIFEALVASKDIQQQSIERFNHQLLSVEAQTAQATYPADAEMILGMISDSIGIDQFNGMIREAIFSFLHKRYDVLYVQELPIYDPSCFSGEGKVLLGDRKNWKYVKDMKEGEKVITHEGIVAEIVLVTIDEIAKGELEMCEVGGVWLTPEHPVLVESGKKQREKKWELPKNIVATQRRSIDRVYNFELSRGGNSVLINGLAVITLGNDKKLPGDDLYGSGWKRNPQRKKYADARGIQLQ